MNRIELHRKVLERMKAKSDGLVTQLTDSDAIRCGHRFLWDSNTEPEDWEQRLAKKYYDKLFKEYAICDLARYKENKIAMRWRTEEEVISSKGQFICGSKKCPKIEGLKSWEVNFTYIECGEKRSALVKLRLCDECSQKLNHHSMKRIAKRSHRLRHSTEQLSPFKSKTIKQKINHQNKAEDKDQDNDLAIEINTSNWCTSTASDQKSREEEFADYLDDLLL